MLRGGKPKKTLKLKGPVLDATGRMLTFNFAKTSVGKGFLLVITPGRSWCRWRGRKRRAPITITISPTVTAAAARKPSFRPRESPLFPAGEHARTRRSALPERRGMAGRETPNPGRGATTARPCLSRPGVG